jgi:hypothetical protein
MRHRNRGKKALVLWILVFLLGAADLTIVRAAQGPTNDPARIIPADALFCIRVNKLATSLGEMDKFLAGISPMSLSMPVQAGLGKLLGAPEPAGLNMTGDFAVFGPLPGGEKPDPKRVGVLVPISDFQQFLTNPNVVKPDAQGILKLNAEGKPGAVGIQMGNYVLFTRAADQQALLEAKNWTSGAGTASLAQRLAPDELKRATGSPVWAYANIQIVAKLYGPMLQQKIKEATKKMQEAQAKGGPMMGPPPAALDMWTSLITSFLQETQLVSLTLDPSAAALRLASVVAGVPNSDMAKILSTSGPTQPQPNLLGYTENGAMSTGVATFSPEFLRAVTLKRVELFTAMAGAMMSKEDLARGKKLATDSADALGGAVAWSVSGDLKGKPPFRLRRIDTVKDRQKLNNVLDDAAKFVHEGAFAEAMKKFGVKMQFTFKRSAETYKNVPIDVGAVTIELVDANSPQAQMMKTVFGSGYSVRTALVNDLWLTALAPDPDQEIHALIDQAQSGAPKQAPSEVQAAMQLLPEARNATFFGTYNVVRYLQLVMSIMPLPIPKPQGEMPAGSDIAFDGIVGGGRLLTNIAIPKEQVEALVKMFVSMKQQQMQQQKQSEQPGMQPRPAPGTSPAGKPGQT